MHMVIDVKTGFVWFFLLFGKLFALPSGTSSVMTLARDALVFVKVCVCVCVFVIVNVVAVFLLLLLCFSIQCIFLVVENYLFNVEAFWCKVEKNNFKNR